MRPTTNGLIEFVDEKRVERGFFCMRLVGYINDESPELGTEQYAELWRKRFDEARSGECAYKGKCPIYAKTKKIPMQLGLF